MSIKRRKSYDEILPVFYMLEDSKKRKVIISEPDIQPPFKLENLDDLLYLAWNYKGEAFDWFKLWSMIPILTELNQLIGMKELKRKIIDLIIYHLQNLNYGGDDMLHTVLIGSPGVGKTKVAHILAKIYSKLGFLEKDNVVVAKRSDFIGKWVGHTESKTEEIFEKAKGSVLFIDEAYSMGQNERVESFSKAAIDLLNQHLSENKENFICIIAGYEKELDENFFSVNSGLRSRFPWRFKIEGYDGDELFKMFEQKIKMNNWELDKTIKGDFFQKNLKLFPYFGRDVDHFITFCRIAHSYRIFGTTQIKRLITKEDLEVAIKSFKDSRKKEEISEAARSMYG